MYEKPKIEIIVFGQKDVLFDSNVYPDGWV